MTHYLIIYAYLLSISSCLLATEAVLEYDTPAVQKTLESLGKANAKKCIQGEETLTKETSKFEIFDGIKNKPSEEEQELRRLEDIHIADIPLKEAKLYAAIELCAQAASMHYIAPEENDFNESVTLKVRKSPFQLLKLMAEAYGFNMTFCNRVWSFTKVNRNQLITKTYQLLYNNQEVIKRSPPSINAGLKNEMSGSASGAQGGFNSNQEVFSVKTDSITKEIEKILELPTTGTQAATEESLNDKGKLPSFFNKVEESSKGKVIYISDSNQLLIIATQQQHSYIEHYLKAIDQPQRLIKIEAKFVETNRDPKKEFGINWNSLNDAKLSLSELNGNIAKTGLKNWPSNAILSSSDLALQFHFIANDSKSDITQNPRVVTTNNRKVSLKSVVQQPIVSSNNTQISSINNAVSSSIDYIEVGTIIDIYPQIMSGKLSGFKDECVQLNISIIVSSIAGESLIGKNSYPVVSSRTYDYSVIIPSGYTLAIGGLTENNNIKTESKVHGLGDIPVFGHLFKHRSDKKHYRNLIAYITPTILNSVNQEIIAAE